jgi:hypothetical protein
MRTTLFLMMFLATSQAFASYYITDNTGTISWKIQADGNGVASIKGNKGSVIKSKFSGDYRKLQKDYVEHRAHYIHEFKNPTDLNFEYDKNQKTEEVIKNVMRDFIENSQDSEVEAISTEYDLPIKFDVKCTEVKPASLESECVGKYNFQVMFELF